MMREAPAAATQVGMTLLSSYYTTARSARVARQIGLPLGLPHLLLRVRQWIAAVVEIPERRVSVSCDASTLLLLWWPCRKHGRAREG